METAEGSERSMSDDNVSELLSILEASMPYLRSGTRREFAIELVTQGLDALSPEEWGNVIGAALKDLVEGARARDR